MGGEGRGGRIEAGWRKERVEKGTIVESAAVIGDAILKRRAAMRIDEHAKPGRACADITSRRFTNARARIPSLSAVTAPSTRVKKACL